jgi:hypothetical protein
MELIFWITYAALWVMVAVQGVAFLELLRQTAQMREQLSVYTGPSEQAEIFHVGEPLPESGARWALDGKPVRWEDHLGRDLSVLVILHPGCLTCHGVAEGLPRLISSTDSGAAVLPIVEARSLDAAREFMEELHLDPEHTILDEEPTLSRGLNLSVKPAAVTLFGREVVSAATVKSASQVEILLRDAEVRLRARQRGAEAQAPAPSQASPKGVQQPTGFSSEV